MKRLAIVLFNLGGPDGPGAVEPFLFNLFNDPAIIGAPGPVRWLLAKFISKRRAPFAREIYAHIGGASPLLGLTWDQAHALDGALDGQLDEVEVKSFVCMRYWHPMSDETAKAVKAYAPDQIVLLPLYPQFSTTTTQSSFDDWARAAARVGLEVATKRVCCYPSEPGFVKAQALLLKDAIAQAGQNGDAVRVLFSAHGLPKKIVDKKGDPYPEHVALGANAIVEAARALGVSIDDWRVSYQSRVGPLEWIGPSTDDEIERAGGEGRALVVLPIAFVSEHSETLVELDIEYKELADKAGVKAYVRVPAVATAPDFINGLAALVKDTLACSGACSGASSGDPCPQGGNTRICTAFAHACPARMIG